MASKRVRVYELARELNLKSKELIERAQALGFSQIQSHANALEDSEVRELKSKISSGAGRQEKSEKKTVLKRRVTKGKDGGGYELQTIRLSPGGGKKVIESKTINMEIAPIPTFDISTPEEAPVEAPAEAVAVSETPAAPTPAGEVAVAETSVAATPASAPETQPAPAVETPSAPVAEAPTEAAEAQPAAPATTEEAAPAVAETPAKEPVVEATTPVATPAPPSQEPAAEIAPPAEAQTVETPVAEAAPAPAPKKAKPKPKKEPAAPPIKISADFKDESDNLVQLAEKYKEEDRKEPPTAAGTEPKAGPQTIELNKHRSPTIAMTQFETEFETRNRRRTRAVKTPPRNEHDKNAKGNARGTAGGSAGGGGRGGNRKKSVVPQRGKQHRKNKRRDKKKSNPAQVTAPMSEKKRVVKVDEAITVGGLAHEMGVKASELIKKLLKKGVFATINQALTIEEATELAKEFNYDVQNVGFQEADIIPAETASEDAPESLQSRPPVVTVMGHVDHGKTSLLDAIRGSDVAASEAGGITQHIGASVVHLKNKGRLVFLDTPGHEAFTAMRSRGAQCTDIVILVVAADDGVMPQTIEAINHAKAAGVPLVVAVNKCDKPGANPDNARYALMQHDLVPEELGGDVMMFNVSAHTRQGLDELLDGVLLQAEVAELQANPDKPATGIVVESKMEKGRGPVATILVSEGTLNRGDTIVAGTDFGRIRSMENDRQQGVNVAGPSIPVKVTGLSGTPEPGDRFDVVADEKAAKQIIEHRRLQKQREEQAQLSKRNAGLLWGLEESKKVNIIVKADTQGTLEAIKGSLLQLQHDEIEVTIPHAAVGGITENDINLASTTNSLVFGFHVRADNNAQRAAESDGVEIRIFRVIYELIDAVKALMEQELAPTFEEKPIGQAEIRKTFNIPKAGRVAGCYVTEGKITRGALIRLYRENIQIYEGKVATLRRFKDDVKEVAHGFECGIQIEGYQDIREGDMIEAYEIKEVAQKLEL